ncbi:MAG TPA: bifunctional diaminohydroxyphosphoribosylaminopyrimidine deaminase/5-amino-6-(5-phosphoribosylamino)uracil reductase RibD [Vicinamibacterales bacterium]|nr:bifunctional diaminohydroxyphosphoribosylaminopyrimidine deaminase/5-amino-6-(5-phosphoribosylamino)uracil reductase RibD [Vicinamibacterales bacterium]
MRRALCLAERGRGRTTPNPLVGAVIVDESGVIVGDGYHAAAGQAHAEVRALDAAGPRARGATLYCTLEPCCHTGRTGPCVDRIVAAGIRRVVAATMDPNPLVAGGGFRALKAHGLDIVVGVEEEAARRQNAAFFTWIRERRPYVIAKAAVSLDGSIAAAPGVRTAITGPPARRLVQRTRAEVDAVGVGSGTVLADDPMLTARDVYRTRPLLRVVFDRRLRIPLGARLVASARETPVLVLTSARVMRDEAARADALEAAGVRVEVLEDESLEAAMGRLAELGVTSLLLEGGAALHAAAWKARMIDRVQLFVAPHTLGEGGLRLFGGAPFSVAELENRRVTPCGADVLIEGDVQRTR